MTSFPTSIRRTLAILACLVGLIACASNQGVEAGNPDLKKKSLTLEILTENASFAAKILEDGAVVSQIEEESFETIAADPSWNEGWLGVEAAFSDGTDLGISLAFGSEFQLLGSQITSNGRLIEATIRVAETPDESSDPGQAFLELASALCERIVACNESFTQESCEAEMLAAPGLSQDFGEPSSESLGESQAKLDSGELSIDAEALELCVAGIEIVECRAVRRNFQDGEAADYSKAGKIVPKPVCARGVLR